MKKATTEGEAPILDLAIRGDVLASADGDGRVKTFRLDGTTLTPLATLHHSAKKPMVALAATDSGFVGAGASLVSWSVDGKVLASAALPDVATNVVVRGDRVFVVAGGALHAFELPNLEPEGKIKLAKGAACDLDVDDAKKRALVVRDGKHVELIDLAKKKSLADWTRKGKVDSVSVRFDADGEVLSVCDDDRRLTTVKDTTGRVTGEVIGLGNVVNGPIALDRERKVAAVVGAGEDVQVVELDPPRTLFYLDPAITPGKLGGMKRIPTFAAIAPGLYARRGSTEAPPTRRR